MSKNIRNLVVVFVALLTFQQIAAASDPLNPPYLNEMPCAARVFAQTAGTDDRDTAGRQAATFWQLLTMISEMGDPARQTRQQFTPDELRIANEYFCAYISIVRPIFKTISTPEEKQKWADLQECRFDRTFHDGLLQIYFSPDLQAQLDKVDAAARASGGVEAVTDGLVKVLSAPDISYLARMPSAEQVMKDLTIKDPHFTVARQAKAMLFLCEIIDDMAGARSEYGLLSPKETQLEQSYSDAYKKIDDSMASPGERLAFLHMTLMLENDRFFYGLMGHYFPPDFVAEFKRNRPAHFAVISGLDAPDGGRNPLAGQDVFLLKDSLDDALSKAGIGPPAGMTAGAAMLLARINKTPDIQKMTDAMTADCVDIIATDSDGSGQFSGVRPGTYYLVSSISNPRMVWSLKIDLHAGPNDVTLDEKNAETVK